jgi:hypothetical protein
VVSARSGLPLIAHCDSRRWGRRTCSQTRAWTIGRSSETSACVRSGTDSMGPATWRCGDVQPAADVPVAGEMAREASGQAPAKGGRPTLRLRPRRLRKRRSLSVTPPAGKNSPPRTAGTTSRAELAAASCDDRWSVSSRSGSAADMGHRCSLCLIATAPPRKLSPIARARRAYAPDATAPPEWDLRWSSQAGVPGITRRRPPVVQRRRVAAVAGARPAGRLRLRYARPK